MARKRTQYVRLPALLKMGGALGAAYGAWMAWELRSFDGFSVGPPPPPTPADAWRLFFLGICLKTVLFLGFSSLGITFGAAVYGVIWLGRKSRGE